MSLLEKALQKFSDAVADEQPSDSADFENIAASLYSARLANPVSSEYFHLLNSIIRGVEQIVMCAGKELKDKEDLEKRVEKLNDEADELQSKAHKAEDKLRELNKTPAAETIRNLEETIAVLTEEKGELEGQVEGLKGDIKAAIKVLHSSF